MRTREKIIECADGIIDYMSEQMIVPRIKEDFGNDLTIEQIDKIANIVYQQIKTRM